MHHQVETIRQLVGGLPRHGDLIVAEDRDVSGFGKRNPSAPHRVFQLGNLDPIDGGIHLGIEVVNPELIEVAKHGVARPPGNEARPVVEGLAVVPGQVLPAFLHFDENDRLPDQIRECRSPSPRPS